MTSNIAITGRREHIWGTARFDIGQHRNLDWKAAWRLLAEQGHGRDAGRLLRAALAGAA